MTRTADDVMNTLQRTGMLTLRLFGRETADDMHGLDEALENAALLDKYAQDAVALEKKAWNTLPNSREWQAFFSAQRKYLGCMRRHSKNGLKYGWSPLARKLLWQQYLGLCEKEGIDTESDPMEALFREYGIPIYNEETSVQREDDAQDKQMEELLSGKWNADDE